jgi:hypothetical protein
MYELRISGPADESHAVEAAMPHAFVVVVAIALGLQGVQPVRAPLQPPDFAGSWTLEHVAGDPRSRAMSINHALYAKR